MYIHDSAWPVGEVVSWSTSGSSRSAEETHPKACIYTYLCVYIYIYTYTYTYIYIYINNL